MNSRKFLNMAGKQTLEQFKNYVTYMQTVNYQYKQLHLSHLAKRFYFRWCFSFVRKFYICPKTFWKLVQHLRSQHSRRVPVLDFFLGGHWSCSSKSHSWSDFLADPVNTDCASSGWTTLYQLPDSDGRLVICFSHYSF